jgi:hypothetical protein
MGKPEGEAIYSVSWRLRRATVEYAYVSVPIASDMVRLDAQGVIPIDAEAVGRRAVDVGQSPDVV